jgi:hypothetical protein
MSCPEDKKNLSKICLTLSNHSALHHHSATVTDPIKLLTSFCLSTTLFLYLFLSYLTGVADSKVLCVILSTPAAMPQL